MTTREYKYHRQKHWEKWVTRVSKMSEQELLRQIEVKWARIGNYVDKHRVGANIQLEYIQPN